MQFRQQLPFGLYCLLAVPWFNIALCESPSQGQDGLLSVSPDVMAAAEYAAADFVLHQEKCSKGMVVFGEAEWLTTFAGDVGGFSDSRLFIVDIPSDDNDHRYFGLAREHQSSATHDSSCFWLERLWEDDKFIERFYFTQQPVPKGNSFELEEEESNERKLKPASFFLPFEPFAWSMGTASLWTLGRLDDGYIHRMLMELGQLKHAEYEKDGDVSSYWQVKKALWYLRFDKDNEMLPSLVELRKLPSSLTPVELRKSSKVVTTTTTWERSEDGVLRPVRVNSLQHPNEVESSQIVWVFGWLDKEKAHVHSPSVDLQDWRISFAKSPEFVCPDWLHLPDHHTTER